MVLALADLDLETFGRVLRYARRELRMSAGDLADALTARGLRVSQQAVGTWERGENEPSRDKVFALEEILQRPGALSAILGYSPADDVSAKDQADFNTRIAHISPGARRAIEAIIEDEERRLGE